MASADTPSYLVLDDFCHRGWTARVDGQSARVFIANALFRAVEIGPGSHTVRFRLRARFAHAWRGSVSSESSRSYCRAVMDGDNLARQHTGVTLMCEVRASRRRCLRSATRGCRRAATCGVRAAGAFVNYPRAAAVGTTMRVSSGCAYLTCIRTPPLPSPSSQAACRPTTRRSTASRPSREGVARTPASQRRHGQHHVGPAVSADDGVRPQPRLAGRQ